MTMQDIHSPKPKIFGDGYGKHVSCNYRLMKRFFWLGWKLLANTFIPGVFYESAHWEIINLYYKMRGYRHGTNSDHRCNECGADLPSSDEAILKRAKLKILEQQIKDLEKQIPDMIEQIRVEPEFPDSKE